MSAPNATESDGVDQQRQIDNYRNARGRRDDEPFHAPCPSCGGEIEVLPAMDDGCPHCGYDVSRGSQGVSHEGP